MRATSTGREPVSRLAGEGEPRRRGNRQLAGGHQATFDLADSGAVIFGPPTRPLPQLPLAVDDDGYLVAQSDFTEPVGPSYWERET